MSKCELILNSMFKLRFREDYFPVLNIQLFRKLASLVTELKVFIEIFSSFYSHLLVVEIPMPSEFVIIGWGEVYEVIQHTGWIIKIEISFSRSLRGLFLLYLKTLRRKQIFLQLLICWAWRNAILYLRIYWKIIVSILHSLPYLSV